ncbi:MAG TPA: hypothetical protein ENJ94_08475 [Gammaproteobacteria bacterium]|nr:hypothetical protein [Gammaproteobacteria bacterium]
MKDILFWAAIGGGEVLLLLLVLLTIYWWRHSAAARRDRAAVAQLVKAVREGRQAREATIQGFLAEHMGLQGTALDQARVAILREELGLLQRFAAIYGRRDAGAAAQFHLALEAAVAPYLALKGNGAAAPVDAGTGDAEELEALRRENQRLSEELSVTMETMSRMLNEYSSMFAGGVPADAAVSPEAEAPAAAGEPATSEQPEGESVEAEAAGETEAETVAAAASEPASEADGIEPEGAPARAPVELDEAMLDIGAGEEEPVAVSGESEVATDAEVADAAPVEAPLEEPVAPEAIDELLADDPLADDLGDLFDEEELAALDEASDQEKVDEESAIAI